MKSASLAYFFLKEKEFYLSDNIDNELELQKEFKRIYSLAKKEHCPITHFLMRGSLNVFFGAITQNVMYCKHHQDFLDRLNIGRTIFNEFLTLLFRKMHEDPFRLDDTENPMVANMHKQQTAANQQPQP